MTKKFSWEVEKTSLVLKVTDGAKETTWKIRKTTKTEDLPQVLEEMQLALWESHMDRFPPLEPTMPMFETVRTVDAEELAELQGYPALQADSEEASRAAQAAQVAKLSDGAKWFDVDEDESYSVDIPSFDDGEVKPR